jgi:hypothetical protein
VEKSRRFLGRTFPLFHRLYFHGFIPTNSAEDPYFL